MKRAIGIGVGGLVLSVGVILAIQFWMQGSYRTTHAEISPGDGPGDALRAMAPVREVDPERSSFRPPESCPLATCGPSASSAQARAGIAGTYRSVTKSECNLELELRRRGEAIVRRTCRSEDSGHREDLRVDTARWMFADGEVRIEGAGAPARFSYRERLPYRSFGHEGAGRGLEPVMGPGERDRVDLYGYGELWRHPLPDSDAGPVTYLAPGAFEDIPPRVRAQLEVRGCRIPQAWGNAAPHNVVSGRFASPDQIDWAALCSVDGASRVVILWGGPASCPNVFSASPDAGFTSPEGTGFFSRGITAVPASRVQDPRYWSQPEDGSPPSGHDALSDAYYEVEATAYYCHGGRWTLFHSRR